jgi:putative transposase
VKVAGIHVLVVDVGLALPGTVTPGWEDVRVAVHQAFCFELDPNNQTRSALASHAGAARFAFNTMLAYVRWALDARAFERRTTGVAVTEVPWTLPSLRKVWNHQVKDWAAPWWPQNAKEAYSSGLSRLADALQLLPVTTRPAGRAGHGVPQVQKEDRPAIVSGDHRGLRGGR